MIKAIETRYKGYRFRSRLEARWAVFFNALAPARWEYEFEGFDLGQNLYYLPDFRFTQPNGETAFWVEIKGQNPDEIEQLKIEKLANGLHQVAVIAYGVPGEERYLVYDPEGKSWFGDQHIGNYPIWCDLLRCKDYWSVLDDIKAKYDQNAVGFPSVFTAITDEHKLNCNRLLTAYTAARSARFEYGETP